MQFKAESLISIFDVGVASAFALLHLLLFPFYPRQGANLFFSLFAASVAVHVFSTDAADKILHFFSRLACVSWAKFKC